MYEDIIKTLENIPEHIKKHHLVTFYTSFTHFIVKLLFVALNLDTYSNHNISFFTCISFQLNVFYETKHGTKTYYNHFTNTSFPFCKK